MPLNTFAKFVLTCHVSKKKLKNSVFKLVLCPPIISCTFLTYTFYSLKNLFSFLKWFGKDICKTVELQENKLLFTIKKFALTD